VASETLILFPSLAFTIGILSLFNLSCLVPVHVLLLIVVIVIPQFEEDS